MRRREFDDLRVQILLLKKNKPDRARELVTAIDKLDANTERASTVLFGLFRSGDGLRAEASHLKEMARGAALLADRSDRLDRRLAATSVWPSWMTAECRRELGRRVEGWRKECATAGIEASRPADLLEGSRELAEVGLLVDELMQSIQELDTAYRAMASLDGPSSGEHRSQLLQLQARLTDGQSRLTWRADVAAIHAAIEADGRNANGEPPVAFAVRSLDAAVAEAVAWGRVMGPVVADPMPLANRRQVLDPGRDEDVRHIYELLDQCQTFCRIAGAAAQQQFLDLKSEAQRRYRALAGIVDEAAGLRVPMAPVTPLVAGEFDIWRKDVGDVLSRLNELGPKNLALVRDRIEAERRATSGLCGQVLAESAPDSVLRDARKLAAELALHSPAKSFDEALDQIENLGRLGAVAADLVSRTQIATDEWKAKSAEAGAVLRQYNAAIEAFGPTRQTSILAVPVLVPSARLEPQAAALAAFRSELEIRLVTLRERMEREISAIRAFLSEVCEVTHGASLLPATIPAADGEIDIWTDCVALHRRAQEEAMRHLAEATKRFTAEARQEAAAVLKILPGLDPGEIEAGRRLCAETEAEPSEPNLDDSRRCADLPRRLREFREQAQAFGRDLAVRRLRVGRQFDYFFGRRLNLCSPRFLCDRVAGLLQVHQSMVHQSIIWGREQERLQLIEAEALLNALEAHAVQTEVQVSRSTSPGEEWR